MTKASFITLSNELLSARIRVTKKRSYRYSALEKEHADIITVVSGKTLNFQLDAFGLNQS